LRNADKIWVGKPGTKKTFGPKRQEVPEGWGILLNEEFRNLYASPDIIREIKSRRLGGDGQGM
jgi:hypothetical protein